MNSPIDLNSNSPINVNPYVIHMMMVKSRSKK